jgi:hypothetical protein
MSEIGFLAFSHFICWNGMKYSKKSLLFNIIPFCPKWYHSSKTLSKLLKQTGGEQYLMIYPRSISIIKQVNLNKSGLILKIILQKTQKLQLN